MVYMEIRSSYGKKTNFFYRTKIVNFCFKSLRLVRPCHELEISGVIKTLINVYVCPSQERTIIVSQDFFLQKINENEVFTCTNVQYI